MIINIPGKPTKVSTSDKCKTRLIRFGLTTKDKLGLYGATASLEQIVLPLPLFLHGRTGPCEKLITLQGSNALTHVSIDLITKAHSKQLEL